ncbi:MAG: hypothetical protein LBG47_09115 [Prevotellaceae bacterium]|nr:hypothetical protein [Prevotellaceae bacterium]
MKRVAIMMILCAVGVTVLAAPKRVAVFEPAGDVLSQARKMIVVDDVSAVIVANKSYVAVDRNLTKKLLEEYQTQSQYADESQLVEMGKFKGADAVCVIMVIPVGERYYISIKLVELKTWMVEKQGTIQTTRENISSAIQSVATQLFAR